MTMSVVSSKISLQRCRVSKSNKSIIQRQCKLVKKPDVTATRQQTLCPASSAIGEENEQLYTNPDENDQEEFVQPTELTSTSYDTPADNEESRQLALLIAKVAWETKADDVMVLHVAPLVYWTRYMVFATAFSKPQLNALLGKATKEALEMFDRRPNSGGEGKSEWELVDFGDVVLHVMTPDQREYYDLESFYGAAEELELPFAVEDGSRGPTWEKSM